VTALKLEACGRQYRVAWWQDGCRREDWLLAWEIKGAKPGASVDSVVLGE